MGGNEQAAAKPYQSASQPAADAGSMGYTNYLGATNYAGANQQPVQSLANNIGQGNTYNSGAATSAGNQLIGQSSSLIPYAKQALATGFDPQSALYKQQFGQQQDQNRATQSANGVTGTPYAAGVENQANQNFDLNWQNQELQRQQQGAQTASSIYGTAASNAQQGTALGQSVGNNQLDAYRTADQTGAMANQNTQQVIQDFLAYLQQGTSANNAATQATSVSNAAAGANFQQGQTWLTDIGSGVGDLFGFL